MPVKNPKETFVYLLSHVRQGQEKTTTILDEMSKLAQHPEIKEALEALEKKEIKAFDSVDDLIKELNS